MGVRLLILCAGLLSGAANANPLQFDLKCSGTEKIYDNGKQFERPFTRAFHIDISRGEYCVDACSSMQRVGLVDALQITFANEDNHGGAMDKFVRKEQVDRRTGKYDWAFHAVSSDEVLGGRIS